METDLKLLIVFRIRKNQSYQSIAGSCQQRGLSGTRFDEFVLCDVYSSFVCVFQELETLEKLGLFSFRNVFLQIERLVHHSAGHLFFRHPGFFSAQHNFFQLLCIIFEHCCEERTEETEAKKKNKGK